MKRKTILVLLIIMALLISRFPSAPAAQKVVIGFPPKSNVRDQVDLYKNVGRYLRGQLGVELEYRPFPSNDLLLDTFFNGEIDGCFVDSFMGAVLVEQFRGEPLAAPDWIPNGPTSPGYIFARRDSGIECPEDMEGRVLALVTPTSTNGFLSQAAYLQEEGFDPAYLFAEVIFAGSHSEACFSVYKSEAEVGGAAGYVFDTIASRTPDFKMSMRILATLTPVPLDGLIVRPGLPEDLKNNIRWALLRMDQSPAGQGALARFGARGFISVTREDYFQVVGMADAIGLDLTVFRYDDWGPTEEEEEPEIEIDVEGDVTSEAGTGFEPESEE